jgi:N-acylneuraminate cytidylyltransferase
MKVAVIPARGGSKRIPRKNIKPFAGRPILSYSVEAALESACFDRIIVSTDDAEIAAVAKGCGAEVPFVRPPELSDDFVGTNAVVRHAIEWLQGQGQTVEYACSIYPTAPLLQAHYLRAGLDALVTSGKAFALGITSYPFAIQRAVRLLPDGALDAFFPEHRMTRSQDLEPAYHDAGQFLWGRATSFLEDAAPFARHSIGVVLPRYLVADIDTAEDWLHAEYLFKGLKLRAVSDVGQKTEGT